MRDLLSALGTLGVGCCLLSACSSSTSEDWPVFGGNAAGQHYSPLAQIDRTNVARLQAVWRFDAGVGELQTNPLVIGRTLYGYTTTQDAIALDAATGKLLWKFSPGAGGQQPARGLTYWANGKDRRLFVTNVNHLYAVDPANGRPITSFGSGGKIDLREGLGKNPDSYAVFLTTPGALFEDLIIVGFRTSESAPAAPGAIRAYDVKTGQLRWLFSTIARPGEVGGSTWPADAWNTAGGGNNWAGMAVDAKRGIVYVPTGSAVSDFYGDDRTGDNLFANSLIALDARSGKRLWHFQGVHHDLWDRDFPSQPVLLTVTRDSRSVDAVAQTSKQGFVYLFDRLTGQPLFPIEERAVARSTVPGEQTAATQPFVLRPAPFARQWLTEDMLTERTPQAHDAAVKLFRTMRSEGPFTPIGLDRPTIVMPGFDGGAEWGGAAVDPERAILYVNANDIAASTQLTKNSLTPNAGLGATLYRSQCAGCHGLERKGVPPDFPSLVGVGSRLFNYQISFTIRDGKGRMPGFPQLSTRDRSALIDFLISGTASPPTPSEREVASAGVPLKQPAYVMMGYNKFLDPDGYPAVKPPWGTLSAIDLNSGEYLWKVPLGEYPELVAQGLKDTGSENYGGPVVTAGGLVFIGATLYDHKFRAFNSSTGQLLWQTPLPFTGLATPVTYMIDGRQYVVIATSGQRDRKGPQGSAYVAFALPDSK